MQNRRDSYADVGRAMRQAVDRATDAGATPAELSVLAAVFYWTATFSRLSDRRTVSQIAAKSGAWDGVGECPRSIRNRTGERLARLAEYGAIVYEPGRGHSRAGRITLPMADEEKHPLTGDLADDKSTRSANGKSPVSVQNGEISHRSARVKSPLSGDHTRRTTRSESDEEVAPRTGDHPVLGPAALRLTAPAPTSDLHDQRNSDGGHDEVHRHLELVTPPRRLADVDPDTYAFEHHPASRIHNVLVGATGLDHQGYTLDLPDDDELDLTPQRQARLMEAITIGDHLGRHLPNEVLEEILGALIADPPTRPRLALRTAREIADEWDIDLPRLTFDGAA